MRVNFFARGYTRDGLFCYTPLYRDFFDGLKRIIEICDIFGISGLERTKGKLTQAAADLTNPQTVRDWAAFVDRVDFIKQAFTDAKPSIEQVVSQLAPEEVARLDEAIHDALEGCNYSATAISVTAIEFRLLRLMKRKTGGASLEGLTLGQLVSKALSDPAYSGLIPDKHKPLL